jgi:hypothetical protein
MTVAAVVPWCSVAYAAARASWVWRRPAPPSGTCLAASTAAGAPQRSATTMRMSREMDAGVATALDLIIAGGQSSEPVEMA